MNLGQDRGPQRSTRPEKFGGEDTRCNDRQEARGDFAILFCLFVCLFVYISCFFYGFNPMWNMFVSNQLKQIQDIETNNDKNELSLFEQVLCNTLWRISC